MKANFDKALDVLFPIEGGVSDRPLKDDPGGLTNRGITHKTYDAWRRSKGLSVRSVRQITDDEVHAIYYEEYWVKVGGDMLPTGLDVAAFDYGVNSGPGKGVKDLQELVGVRADGIMGAQTLAAVKKQAIIPLIDAYMDVRWAYMQRLKNFDANKNGWRTRIALVRSAAKSWVQGSAPAPSPVPEGSIAKADPANTSATADPAVQGTGMIATGGIIEVLNQAAGTLFGFAGDNQVLTILAAAMLVGGVVITAYTIVQRRKET